MTFSEMLSYSTTKITSYYDNEDKTNYGTGTGTGFFIDFNIDNTEGTCQPVIITNKHVVKNAKKISYSVCRRNTNNEPLDKERFTVDLVSFKIINHPDNNVDLCAIPISEVQNQLKLNNIHTFNYKITTDIIISKDEVNKSSTMEDIIMIGYPNGLEDTYNNKPIIRRGITSTHMKFDYNGKKEFLIDMACFPGSSGSPIFFCNDSTYTTPEGLFVGSRIKLLGILYAGPQHTGTGDVIFENIPTNPKTIFNIPNNLGLVIRAERIRELEKIMENM